METEKFQPDHLPPRCLRSASNSPKTVPKKTVIPRNCQNEFDWKNHGQKVRPQKK
jgi:hypothetical protein